ncbi:hypothetical protein GCM10025870_30660 [Agromyces marinus]|uniref:Uncharacterized protein n=1 Tax=Agromyces marinus TaxID=1389020 RepID=A0ABN6YFK4_9MICO|nr:hypothetical protein [Agromyces marinus]BDZ55993.1 hypothetical protein GCM10025870_30660 [Agromyces marinus]
MSVVTDAATLARAEADSRRASVARARAAAAAEARADFAVPLRAADVSAAEPRADAARFDGVDAGCSRASGPTSAGAASDDVGRGAPAGFDAGFAAALAEVRLAAAVAAGRLAAGRAPVPDFFEVDDAARGAGRSVAASVAVSSVAGPAVASAGAFAADLRSAAFAAVLAPEARFAAPEPDAARVAEVFFAEAEAALDLLDEAVVDAAFPVERAPGRAVLRPEPDFAGAADSPSRRTPPCRCLRESRRQRLIAKQKSPRQPTNPWRRDPRSRWEVGRPVAGSAAGDRNGTPDDRSRSHYVGRKSR